MNFEKLVAFFLLATSAIFANAQKPTSKSPAPFDTRPFDASATSLAPSYRGHDCFSIAAALPKLQTSKSEFETANEYQDRMAALVDVRIGRHLRLADRLAFQLEPWMISFKYSAENRSATLSVEPVAVVNVLHPGLRRALELDERKRKQREYVASNAFGVTKEVTEVSSEICALALTGQTYIGLRSWGAITVDMEPQTARAVKENLGALLVGRLSAPMLSEGYVRSTPTLDRPRGRHSEGPVLVLELQDVWYFDRTTGRVLARAEGDRGAREEAREKERVRAEALAKGATPPEAPLTPQQGLAQCFEAISAALGGQNLNIPEVDQSSDRASKVYRFAWGGSAPAIERGARTHRALCMVTKWNGKLEYLEVDGRQVEQR